MRVDNFFPKNNTDLRSNALLAAGTVSMVDVVSVSRPGASSSIPGTTRWSGRLPRGESSRVDQAEVSRPPRARKTSVNSPTAKISSPAVSVSPPIRDLSPSTLFGENLIRINQVPDLLPSRRGGRAVGLASVYRWMEGGKRGIHLEWLHMPWGRATSVEAVERFLAAISGHRRNPRRNIPTLQPRRRKREIEKATQYLMMEFGHNVTKGNRS